jgi:hypothetical protein
MKSYPSISKDVRQDIYIYAFEKYDGSNIRAEWNSKKGFYKFGTKTQLIDGQSQPFGRAIALIKEKYEKDLTIIFQERQWRDAICFFELYGPSSFAGTHNFEEKLDVTLIDVNPYKEGILVPTEFIKLFGHLDIPKVCYEGHVTTELFDKVKNSALNGMTFEGCVCKGNDDGKLIMFKIKSNAWLNKLKIYCKDDISLFKKLE